jgi:hypothetical protein
MLSAARTLHSLAESRCTADARCCLVNTSAVSWRRCRTGPDINAPSRDRSTVTSRSAGRSHFQTLCAVVTPLPGLSF